MKRPKSDWLKVVHIAAHMPLGPFTLTAIQGKWLIWGYEKIVCSP